MEERLCNPPERSWLIQKFGGTSVGKFPDKICSNIVRESLSKHRVVVVCSARSTGKKLEGTTSRLLIIFQKLQVLAAFNSSATISAHLLAEARQLIDSICQDHVRACRAFVRDSSLQTELVGAIERECQELAEYLVAARRFNLEINSRSKDRIISYGEKLSCLFMTMLLRDYGVDTEYVDLGDLLVVPASTRQDASFLPDAAATFGQRLLACGDRVPVVTGFFGNVPGSLIDGNIGRGYTDLCAALCAVALAAAELQVWKEVDGIFTADPSKVPTARLLSSITPLEAAELTFYGSEVIHHLTMDQLVRADPPIPVRIKNVCNPHGHGTVVLPHPPSPHPLRQQPRRPTAVTIKDRIAVINVHSNKRSMSHGFFAAVFATLDRLRIPVDLISTSEVHVSMAIHHAGLNPFSTLEPFSSPPSPPSSSINAYAHAIVSAPPTPPLHRPNLGPLDLARAELEEYGKVTVLRDMAILSLVGSDMKNMIGIAGRMFSSLGDHNINIEMISQGASEINISCVINARDATRAMNVLHTNLFTFLN